MNTPIIGAIAAALFHFLWEGAVMALLLAIALMIFRSAKIRYAIACAALCAMPAAFVATLAFLYPGSSALPDLTRWPHAAGFVSPGTIAGTPEPLLARIQEWMRWFVPAWFAGVAIFYVRSAASWITVVRLRRAAMPIALGEWQRRIFELSRMMGIPRAVEILESRLVDVPVVAGLIRPAIFLPAGFIAGMPPDQLEYLLIHELAHIRRFDYFFNLLQRTIEGLLFYHPAVWWVSGVMEKERENCCDDMVLSLRPEPVGYATTLATLEQSRWAAMPAANGAALTQRIRRILNRRDKHPAPTPALALIALAISTAMAVPVFMRAQPRPQQQAAADANRYERWLKEDVTYIIQDQERSAFNNLGSDEERERFIEQFWVRRDPTPGTPENEFKEEHYRRIAYVNSHFLSPAVPGWKTDRGRIYITFGPPDEIDSHPACGAGTPPHEDWRYRFIEGIGNNVNMQFVDASCNGEYRMTMDPNESDQYLIRKEPR